MNNRQEKPSLKCLLCIDPEKAQKCKPLESVSMKIIKTHWMTRREWVAKHKPGRVDAAFVAGVEGCPENYGFTDASSDGCNSHGRTDCERCFDRLAKVGGKYILVKEGAE